MTSIERYLKWKLCDVIIPKREYRCRICGETLFFRGTKDNDIKMHFYNKHREIYLIARKCDLGETEYCDMLDVILKKYGKNVNEGEKNEKL
jgi:hypothetical protein